MFMRSSPAWVWLVVALTLSACATKDEKAVTDAATAPLSDLNIVRADIPAVLVEAQKQPYAVPEDQSCDSLGATIKELDGALGADLDQTATAANPSLIERGTDQAKNSAIGTLRTTTESVVPFRGWVRKLSGAERYSNKVAASITAGTIRRAFLKGLRVSKACS